MKKPNKATTRSEATEQQLLEKQELLFNQAEQSAEEGFQKTERTYFLFFLYCAQEGISSSDAIEHIMTANNSIHALLVCDLCKQAYTLNTGVGVF